MNDYGVIMAVTAMTEDAIGTLLKNKTIFHHSQHSQTVKLYNKFTSYAHLRWLQKHGLRLLSVFCVLFWFLQNNFSFFLLNGKCTSCLLHRTVGINGRHGLFLKGKKRTIEMFIFSNSELLKYCICDVTLWVKSLAEQVWPFEFTPQKPRGRRELTTENALWSPQLKKSLLQYHNDVL